MTNNNLYINKKYHNYYKNYALDRSFNEENIKSSKILCNDQIINSQAKRSKKFPVFSDLITIH